MVFPLGTNDLSASTFGASLAAARGLAGGRCMVVATIARPNLRGSSTAELNRVVERFAGGSGAAGAGGSGGGVQVMDWRSAALSTPGVLGRDRIHATGQGYGLRASLLAEAVQGCLLGGDLGGIPAPQNPDAKVPGPAARDPDRPAPRRRRAQPRPTPAAKLPAPELVLALGAMVERVVSVVRPALAGAQTAATKARPEPVLGAPEK